MTVLHSTDTPIHEYNYAGAYNIKVEAENSKGCIGNETVKIEVINSSPTSIADFDVQTNAKVYTSGNEIVIETSFDEQINTAISVLTIEGKLLAQQNELLGNNSIRIPKNGSTGMYLVNLQMDNGISLTYKIQ